MPAGRNGGGTPGCRAEARAIRKWGRPLTEISGSHGAYPELEPTSPKLPRVGEVPVSRLPSQGLWDTKCGQRRWPWSVPSKTCSPDWYQDEKWGTRKVTAREANGTLVTQSHSLCCFFSLPVRTCKLDPGGGPLVLICGISKISN